jgi:acyl-homoserine-lactone acylase
MKESGNLARLKSTVLFCLVLSTGIMSCSSDFKRTEILWDNYGVPHIYARNAQEMYYSFGWAQMSCHADLILKLYAEARGTAAELFGKEYLESDLKMRAFDLPGLARKGYIQQDQEFRSYIDAFTKGMNDYAAENIEMIDENLRKVLPVTVEDIMAHTVRVIHLEFLAGPDLERVKAYEAPGSNSIAVSASRSAGGNTMLVSNPHLPWRGFYTWYEAHLMTEGFNLYGVALVGMPTLSIAFNPHLGWTHTVNTIDASDRYELALKDNGYVLDGEVVPFDMRNVTIKVKHDDGSVTENTHNIRLSRHGPVVGEKGNKAWAVRVAGLENFKILNNITGWAGQQT